MVTFVSLMQGNKSHQKFKKMKKLVKIFGLVFFIAALSSCEKEPLHQGGCADQYGNPVPCGNQGGNQGNVGYQDFTGFQALITSKGTPVQYYPERMLGNPNAQTVKGWIFNVQLETGQRIVVFTASNSRALQFNNEITQGFATQVTLGVIQDIVMQNGMTYQYHTI